MRRRTLKFLLVVLALLALFPGMFWLWSWYQLNFTFDGEGLQFDPVSGVIYSDQSAAGYGLAAALFILLSLILLVWVYHLIRER